MKRPALAALLLLAACARSNRHAPYQVDPSSTAPANRSVFITKLGNYAQQCLVIDAGQTVEWDNTAYARPINVTGTRIVGDAGAPEPYSPRLLGTAATWRHTFQNTGRFDYFDQGGSVNPYYGTKLPGTPAEPARGTVCVRDGLGTCDFLCCAHAADCLPGQTCQTAPDDKEASRGYCVGTPIAPSDASTTD